MTIRKVAVVFVMMAVAVAPMAAQASGQLKGRVTDQERRPVAGATVRLTGINRSVVTLRDGLFRFESLPIGELNVQVTAIAFVSTSKRVMISDSQTELNIVLEGRIVALDELVIQAEAAPGSVRPADDVLGTLLTVGAKSEVLEVKSMNGNVAEKTPRQIFAKVPGVFVYDMDGSGNQVNISTRGLDAHRSWELNVRQDGVLLNSDMYGYPASHYSPPMEAIERIELIRGTAALQYGSQFGGLLNYVTKQADTTVRMRVESQSAGGSLGLVSSYASVGGRIGVVDYQAYAQGRRSEGFRASSNSDAQAQYVALTWHAAPALSFRAQVGRSAYVYQLPGPLNDSMFRANPRAATRSRNYFNPDIIIPALALTWDKSAATRLTAQLSGVFGNRSSVQFVGFATARDTVQTATGAFLPRQVDIDGFNSHTGEVRLTHKYAIGEMKSLLATGMALTFNDLHRRQQGTGTTGTDYSLALSTGTFRRDVHYKTENVAVYVENDVGITSRWSVVPGFRIENGRTRMRGTLAYYDPDSLPRTVNHNAPLFGVRSTMRWSARSEAYGGWSQAYRPMILKDLLPETAIERTDPNVKDARGWTLELGQRGTVRSLYYDVSAFALRYNDRFGVQAMSDASGPYLFKTNVGSTLTRGVELAIDAPVFAAKTFIVRASTATSYFDATYRRGTLISGGANVSVVGNRVESVPRWITRNGLHLATGRTTATFLVSYVGDSYADALNTITPTATGSVGLVPAYTVVDVNGSVELRRGWKVRGGVNNLLDATYFTKRPMFYPGPGIWPSDGRTLQLSLDVDFAAIGR